MRLIKDQAIVDDSWLNVPDGQALPQNGDVIVSLTRWRETKTELQARKGKLGLRLKSDEEPEAIAADIEHFALIAVEFPKFTDGRGYTTGRLLRDRFGFKGELRAVGHVLRDQMFYMWRCGFNAFELPEGKSLEDALTAYKDFSVTYQAAADDPRPLFRRVQR
jgi:uncharacterized protein (DUF934 family)